jgi:hypothetical protein
MQRLSVHDDESGDPRDSERGLLHLAPVAYDEAEARLGAGSDADDARLAAERGDVGAGPPGRVGVAQTRPQAGGGGVVTGDAPSISSAPGRRS